MDEGRTCNVIFGASGGYTCKTLFCHAFTGIKLIVLELGCTVEIQVTYVVIIIALSNRTLRMRAERTCEVLISSEPQNRTIGDSIERRSQSASITITIYLENIMTNKITRV